MTSVDTNVSSYTISELMAIIEVNDIDPEEIIKNTTALISKLFEVTKKHVYHHSNYFIKYIQLDIDIIPLFYSYTTGIPTTIIYIQEARIYNIQDVY